MDYEYVPEHRCEDDRFQHNYFCQTYSGMQGFPDEEGTWVDDYDWIKSWVEDHIQSYGDRKFKLKNSRPNYYNGGLHIIKDPLGLYKIQSGWQYVKDNEGYFYLKSGKKEWIIYCDDVYATYDMIMKAQDDLFFDEGFKAMMYEEEYNGAQ